MCCSKSVFSGRARRPRGATVSRSRGSPAASSLGLQVEGEGDLVAVGCQLGEVEAAGRPGRTRDDGEAVLTDAGITVVKTPARCPKANAIAERWIRTLCAELTDRILILGQHHLRRVLTACLGHSNHDRPHRSLDLQPPRPPTAPINLAEHRRTHRKPILGELINEYEQAA